MKELYDLELNPITSSGCTTKATVVFDPTYAEDSPTVSLDAVYDESAEQLSVRVLLEEGSRLGAGDFVLSFDEDALVYSEAEKSCSVTLFNINEKNVAGGILKFHIVSVSEITEGTCLLTVTFDVKHECVERLTEIGISGSGLTDSMTNGILLNFRDTSVSLPILHDFGDWVTEKEAGETSKGLMARSCKCGERQTEVIPAKSRVSTSLTLGSDLSVNAYANLTDATGVTARFTMNGQTTEVTGEYVSSVGLWRFIYEGVIPINMGDAITIELLKDGEVFTTVENYSIRRYCTDLMSMSATELGLSEAKYAAIRTLAADLLDYGAAAQIYVNYKTDELVNEGIEGASEYEELTSTDMKLTKYKTVTGVKFTAATLRFNNANRLCFKFTASDVSLVKIRITYGTNTFEYTAESFVNQDGVYALYTPDLYATAFDRIYTATLIYDGEEIQQATYSVRSYVYSKQNDPDTALCDLVRATYKYGRSAKAYATAK